MKPRADPRRRVYLSGKIVHTSSELTVDCSIQDISQSGARLRLASVQPIGEPVYLIDLTNGEAFKVRIAWREEARMGVAFTERYDLSQPDPGRPTILRRLWLEHVR